MDRHASARAFQDWEAAHRKLLQVERLFNALVAQYAKGEGPFPDELHAEIAALRTQVDALFKAAVIAHAPTDWQQGDNAIRDSP